MKNTNKKNIFLSLLLASSLYGSTYEYPQLYKDTKVMGMGGATIAIGGQTSSLFYNTAGLSNIPAEYGWEVDILNLNVAWNTNIVDFTNDLDEATSDDSDSDVEQNAKTLKVVNDHLGENLHMSVNTAILSIGKKFDKYSFGIMPIAGLYVNAKTHRGGGSAGILEAQGMGYSGISFGIARDFNDALGMTNLSVGVGIKAISHKTFYHDFTLAELIDNKDDLATYIDDNYAKEETSTMYDVGFKANISKNLTAGLSFQNIGGMGDSDIIEIPMTIGVGLGYSGRFDRTWLNQYQLAFDLIDITKQYTQDEDITKRTRAGLSVNLLDGWAGTVGLQAGLYQGHPSFGADIRFTMLKIAYSSYAEEVGAYSGQDPDRRHMLQVSFGW